MTGVQQLVRVIAYETRAIMLRLARMVKFEISFLGDDSNRPSKQVHFRAADPGRMSEVQRFLYDMQECGQAPDVFTYNILLDAFCKSRNLDQGIALFRQMVAQRIQPDMCTYNVLIHGLCKGGRLHDARQIFQYLLTTGYNLNVQTYNIMINGLCRKGLFDEAMSLLQRMKTSGCLPDSITYKTLIDLLLEKRENDKAEQLLGEMGCYGLLN